ncbi:MAG: tRNA pseudouridine(55) synthase TruB [Candidatus Chaera renei]|uniref:tRNA pseudouridine synthase B n=1 Tax=Candidatus Chaera renei TaxID=2506947 RepID=A0A4Q0AJC6_9BACT|nr:MAG: tRNA pseudouridine(55) synthase TruB [Candidatus Chaera renei]
MRPSFEGMILLDKPAGITSFGAVARVRRQLSYAAGKKVKVGHTGTLDPFASGLLILLAGQSCRRAGEFLKLDKTYLAALKLGAVSSTGDPEGEITPVAAAVPPAEAVAKTLRAFMGEITQTPPVYSAIKISGQRAYRLARRGQTPVMPPRRVKVYSLELVSYDYPVLNLLAHVSSGTYVRSLAADIGQALGTGAYLLNLRRLSVNGWRVEDAGGLDDPLEPRPLPTRIGGLA